jgi:AraC-like DNA-binding protein
MSGFSQGLLVRSTKKRIVGTGSVVFQDGQRETQHVHREQGQLKWPSTGMASVRTPDGIFVAPPAYAIWIPAGLLHGGMYSGEVFEQNAYVLEEHCTAFPKHCCLVPMGQRLAEALARAVADEEAYGLRTRDEDLALLRLLERDVVDARRRPLVLTYPEASPLQSMLDALWRQPEDSRTFGDWAVELGIPERSLLRTFRRETGSAFRQWRKHARVHRALQRLGAGNAVGAVAEELGYKSTSAFVQAFRATVGVTPARYYGQIVSAPGF